MLHRLSILASQLLVDREALMRTVSWPVLVWEGVPSAPHPGRRSSDEFTLPGRKPQERSLEPVVFEVRPRLPGAMHGAGPGVTVGRGPECDIVLAEPTVSRLHARFRQEPHTGVWTVTDLESHNGTFQDGVLIVPGRPAPLFQRASLRLGGVEVLFLQGCAFEKYVRLHALPPAVRLTRGG